GSPGTSAPAVVHHGGRRTSPFARRDRRGAVGSPRCRIAAAIVGRDQHPTDQGWLGGDLARRHEGRVRGLGGWSKPALAAIARLADGATVAGNRTRDGSVLVARQPRGRLLHGWTAEVDG